MCGRYTITTPGKKLAEYFKAALPVHPITLNTNAKPTQNLPIITEEHPDQIVLAHWGYPIHIGAKEKELINVRAESIETKPFFKRAAEHYRCIILADGFYEWKKEPHKKQPYELTVSYAPIAFAGIYALKEKTMSKESIPFFSIITVPANPFMKNIHDRMPVILEHGEEKLWLDNFDIKMLRPFRHQMKALAVSKL